MKYKLLFTIIAIFIFGVLFYVPKVNEIVYICRETGRKEIEKVPGAFLLRWLYNNPFGKISVISIFKRKFVSEYYGRKMDEKSSALKIPEFVKEYDINMEESEKSIEEFQTFNEFFYRKLKKNARKISEKDIISPADGKIVAFSSIDENMSFFIKGEKFNLKEFLNDKKLAEEFNEGAMAIIRLAPVDYHRYHFPVSGKLEKIIDIKGDYFSVSPIAMKKSLEIFMKNKRSITLIEGEKYNRYLFAEIGATMVGTIVNTTKEKELVLKGEEKGYFKFGGSSVMIIFKKGIVNFDKDILENTKNGYETSVEMGEGIGSFYR